MGNTVKRFSQWLNEEKVDPKDYDNYDDFFDAKLKQWGIDSPEDLDSEKQKKEFFDEVDKQWKDDDEEGDSGEDDDDD